MGSSSRLAPGLLATVSVFLQFFVQAAFIKAFGVLLVEAQSDLQAPTWALGMAFGLVECLNDFTAPIAGPIGKVLGYRPAVMMGGTMASLGFIIASRASNVLQLALALNLLTGIGYAFPHILARATLAQHFENRQFSLASGIGKAGSSVSLFLVPPLLQLYLNAYGWRGAMLLCGSIVAHLVVCGALLIPVPTWRQDGPNDGYQALSDDQHLEDNQAGDKMQKLRSHCLGIGKAFDTSILKEYSFWVINVIYITLRLSKSAWIIYFIPHAVDKGVSSNVAALVVTLAGLGHLVATIVVSVALFKDKLACSTAMGMAIICVAVSLLVDPWMDSLWLLSVNAVLFMAGIGAAFALADVMIKEELGSVRIASALGWIGIFSGSARVLAGFVPGWIHDHAGSYDLAYIVLGAVQMSALLPFIRLLHKRRDTKSTS